VNILKYQPLHPPNHQTPFILQYDHTLLARQFTLIEKDILSNIDWAELIGPTWMDRNPEMVDGRDWKVFIIRDEAISILSSPDLTWYILGGEVDVDGWTQTLAERRLVVSKFIHLAAACQQMHNYATLTQTVTGLQSQHVSALTKTWDGLSQEDIDLWNDLQSLVDSQKNWSKMRNKMDISGVGPRCKGEGCIPFIGTSLPNSSYLGIFMPDLVHTVSQSLQPGKIDIEGLRLRVSIVKKTLRMIELVEEYIYRPESGVGEQCLRITVFNEPMLRIAAGLE
jgi:RasGEF domain